MLYVLLFALVTVSLASDPASDPNYYRRDGYRRGYNRDNYENRGYYSNGRYYNGRGYYRSGEVESKDPCATPKVVGEFNKYFAEEVKNCELLTSVFNGAKNVTREEMKAAIFYLTSVLSEQGGFEKPTSNALNAIANIVSSCEKLTPELLISLYSNGAGKRLNEEKRLCCNNAQVLAQTYAKTMKDVAEAVVGENCPRSKMLSVVVGIVNFMERQGLYDGDNLNGVSNNMRNEWRCQDKNVKPSKSCPIANYSPAKPGLKECDKVCNIKNKAIDLFVNAFSKQVKECKSLQNLFNLQKSVTPTMFSRGTYYVDLLFNAQYNAPNPRKASDFQSRYIKECKTLDPVTVERVHSTFLGKYLLSEKILNEKNAEKLAEMFADIAKDKTEVFVESNVERSKVVAIQTSWRRFLYSLDAMSAETNAKISYYYGNEWRCQAKAKA